MNGYIQDKPLLYVGVKSEEYPGYFIPLQKGMLVNGNMRVKSVNWRKLEFTFSYKKRERHGRKPLTLPMTSIKSIEGHSYLTDITLYYKKFDQSFERWSILQQETYDVEIYDYHQDFIMKYDLFTLEFVKQYP